MVLRFHRACAETRETKVVMGGEVAYLLELWLSLRHGDCGCDCNDNAGLEHGPGGGPVIKSVVLRKSRKLSRISFRADRLHG